MTTATKTEPKTETKTETTTAVAPRAPASPIAKFRGLLETMRPQLSMALPKHLDVDRMLRIIFTTVKRTPKLLECDRDTLLGCIFQCAQLGLEPDGLLGHAYLIPFMNRKAKPARLECQLVVGYKGLLKLARQSGEIASISARVVKAKDTFEYEYGLNEKLRHIPYVVKGDKDDAGPVVFAYAIFRLKDGSYHFDVMGFQEIEWIRSQSPSGDSPAWRDHWDEMAKKTVLRRASKMSPASVDDKMARAISIDERADAGLPQLLDSDDDTLALEEVRKTAELPAKEGQRVPMRRPEVVTEAKPEPEPAAEPAKEEEPEERGDDPMLDEQRKNGAAADSDTPAWVK